MWTPNRSVLLSSICTKVAIVLVVIAAFTMPKLIPVYVSYAGKNPEITNSLFLTVYACFLPVLLSLICLNRLLKNIKRGEVFVDHNVRLLRILSWCSFAFAAILFVSGFYYLLFLVVAACGAILGLILRVIKNVFEHAIIIKREHDLTI